LFIDDHVLNLKLVRKLLEKHGFEARVRVRSSVVAPARAAAQLALLLRTDKPRTQVTTAENGLEGLQLLQASVGGAPGAPPPPAFVLTDMQMCAVNNSCARLPAGC
jgi:CheY-like chemotaxis protein